MKIDESVIDKVLDNKAAPGEARKVAGWFVTEEVTMLRAGYPINVFYGYVTDGLFQNWEEVNRHWVLSSQ